MPRGAENGLGGIIGDLYIRASGERVRVPKARCGEAENSQQLPASQGWQRRERWGEWGVGGQGATVQIRSVGLVAACPWERERERPTEEHFWPSLGRDLVGEAGAAMS